MKSFLGILVFCTLMAHLWQMSSSEQLVNLSSTEQDITMPSALLTDQPASCSLQSKDEDRTAINHLKGGNAVGVCDMHEELI